LLIWQLIDSAFPTGGFAHSGGLEAAWQHGEVRNRNELGAFLDVALRQAGRNAAPLVTATHAEPERLAEFDQLCDAFLTNHIANRASRAQGRAFLTAVERTIQERGVCADSTSAKQGALKRPEGRAPAPPYAHFAPVLGAVLRGLDVLLATTLRMFLFNHLRGLLAAAVRLNIVGPMEAQAIQFRMAGTVESICERSTTLTPEDLAQTAPLLEIWHGAQDRLYSRLFQS
jgi:urease accessory protein